MDILDPIHCVYFVRVSELFKDCQELWNNFTMVNLPFASGDICYSLIGKNKILKLIESDINRSTNQKPGIKKSTDQKLYDQKLQDQFQSVQSRLRFLPEDVFIDLES